MVVCLDFLKFIPREISQDRTSQRPRVAALIQKEELGFMADDQDAVSRNVGTRFSSN
jgi:hypothetical protein